MNKSIFNIMDKMDKKSKSSVPQTYKAQTLQLIDTTTQKRNSFGDRFQSFKQSVFQPENTDLSMLPDKLKKSRDILMNRSINLKDRLLEVAKLLKECKFLNKQNELKLNQDKTKPEILSNMDSMLLKVLIRFLYDVYQEHIEPYSEQEDQFGYQNIFGHLPNNMRPECLVNFQYLVATIYCKLIMEKINLSNHPQEDSIVHKESLFAQRTSHEPVVDQIKLVTFLMVTMIHDSPETIKKDVYEVILYFTEASITDLSNQVAKKRVSTDSSLHYDLLSANPEARPIVETLVICYLAQCASFLDLLDQDAILSPVCKILQLCFRLIEKFCSVFNGTIYDISSSDFPLGFIFKERLLDVNTNQYYSRSTLLNILLQMTKVISGKWKARKNKNLMTEALFKLQDQLELGILNSLDKVQIRQIRIYQLTERFVKVSYQAPLQHKNVPFESIKEVEESFISEDSEMIASQEAEMKQYPQSSYEEIKDGDGRQGYSSVRIIQDSQINIKNPTHCEPGPLLDNIYEQVNWMRVNIALLELSNELMPNYFHRKDSDLSGDQRMSSPKSFIGHLCDLIRVQLYFIVRFSFQKAFKKSFSKPFIEIPDFIDQDCFLIQTLIKLFFFVDYKGQNHDFKATMLRQIYTTLDMLADGHFDAADRLHYLKLEFLLFMNNKLEPLSEPIAVFGNEVNRAYSFVLSLNKLIKIDFYSEKYVKLFEETFDLNSVQKILELQEIVRELEQKRGEEFTSSQNAEDEAVILLNKVLIQQQAINQIVQTAGKSDIVCGIALDALIEEIQQNGMKNCDPQGAIYVERSQHVNLPNGQSQISTLEYKLSQSGPFTSYLYIYLKLAIGILNPQTIEYGRAYDILHSTENHFERVHQAQSYSMSKNSFGFGNSQPMGAHRQNSVNVFNQCDDCQRLNFQQFTLNAQVRPQQVISLFSILLQRIQVLSKSLDDHEQAQASLLGQGQLKQMTTMTAEQIRAHLSKIKQSQSQSKVITKKTLIANQSSGFKIVEKVNGLMTRFLIFCTQNSDLGNSLIANITITERTEIPKFPSLLDSLKLKSQQIGQVQPQNLRDIHNLEFKCLVLRNIIFLIDSKRYDTVTYMLDLFKDTLKQIKNDHAKFKEQLADFKKFMIQLDPFYKQNNSGQGERIPYTRSRERSASNIFFTEFDSQLQKQRFFYKRLAEIQITTLGLYTKVVRKNEHSLDIFERKVFLEQVVLLIQRYITQEGSYISELIQEGLAIFLFQRREPSDPFNIKAQTSFFENPLVQQATQNQLVSVYERMLEFVLTTILDYIALVFNDDPENSSTVESQIAVLQSIKFVFETLNSKIMVREGSAIRESITSELIKLQRSIRQGEIQLLKKIFIFLREQQSTQAVDIQFIIKQISTLLVRLFGTVPKAIHMREFFSLLREIFYYNQQMDDVDVNLAEDVLKILNYSIHFRNKAQIISVAQGPRNEMIDHFVFGKISPGILLLNDFDLGKEPQICLLFRISHEQIAEEVKLSKQKQVRTVLFSLQQKLPEAGAIPIEKIGFDLEIVVDVDQNTFTTQDQPFVATINQNQLKDQQQVKPRQLENRWHLLVLKFKHKGGGFLQNNDSYQVDVYIDKLEQSSRVTYQLPRFDARQKYLVALGNTVELCTSNPDSRVPNNIYFRGRCSLPLFFTGLPDIKNCDQNSEMTLKAVKDCLTEFLNSKEIINKKTLDLNSYLPKYWPQATAKAKSQGQTLGAFKISKKYVIQEFQTLDCFTQPVIQLHQILNRQGYVCAAHCRRASEVFVGLGGFKNMYPLIEKVIKSNLAELGRGKPAVILSQIFRILGSLLDQEPTHIEVQMRKRNLISLLRYSILRTGKYQMVTQELLVDVKNIVKKNILSQVSFSTKTDEESKQYLIQNASADVREHTQFYQDFLTEFTHKILLDQRIATLTCQLISKAHPDISSTTHSSISGGQKSTIVFTEVLDLIHSICAPEPLRNPQNGSRPQKQNGNHSKSSENDKNQESASSNALAGGAHSVQVYCDGEVLQAQIVNGTTIELLMQLVNNSVIIQSLSIQQLTLVGECISSCILFLDDKSSFTQILQKVTYENPVMPKIRLLIYLQIIVQVIRCDDLRNKPQLCSVYNNKDQFKIDLLANILYQFDSSSRDRMADETKNLNDKIIATTLLILVKDFINKKTRMGEKKTHVDKVSAWDPDKKELLQRINKSLAANTQITKETYYTLMQIAFNKKSCSDRPLAESEEVETIIRESKLRNGNNPYSEVIDFDIDFYFIVLESFEKLNEQIKLTFLQHVSTFLKKTQEGFMKVLFGQEMIDNSNPYLKKIKNFYYQLVNLCVESKSDAIELSCQRVLVEICTNQFTRCLDDMCEKQLSKNDEISLTLFRRIFSFFKQEYKVQFQVLQKIIKQILIDVNWGPRAFEENEQEKLTLKLIQMLQFLEEVYIKNKAELAENPLFHQTLALLMFLFEQLGILTLDMPDRITVEGSQDSSIGKYKNLAQYQQKKPLDGQVLGSNSSQTAIKVNIDKQNFMLRSADEFKTATIPVHIQRSPTQQKRQLQSQKTVEFQVINETQSAYKATQNFISGGPVRILLHILLSCMYDARTTTQNFQLVVDLLRYLVLREKTPLIVQQIQLVMTEEFEVSSVLIYNLFNRGQLVGRSSQPNYVSNSLSKLREEDLLTATPIKALDDKKQPESVRNLTTRGYVMSNEQTQDIKQFICQEFEIFRSTVDGIISTTQNHLNNESIADTRIEKPKLPSYKDHQVAEQSFRFLEKRCGFTMIDGFLFLQLIGESIEIISQILKEETSGEKSNDTADFSMKLSSQVHNQLAFVENSNDTPFSNQSVVDDDQGNFEFQLSPQQIQGKLSSSSRLTKISHLLLFLYDCINEQVTGGVTITEIDQLRQTSSSDLFSKNIKDLLLKSVANFLDEQNSFHSSEAKQYITFLCSFVENANNDINLLQMDVQSEAMNESRMPVEVSDDLGSENPSKKQQREVVILNTLGFVDMKFLQQEINKKMIKKKESEVVNVNSATESNFQTPKRPIEISKQNQETKLIKGGIRMSDLQIQYFGEDSLGKLLANEESKDAPLGKFVGDPPLSKLRSEQPLLLKKLQGLEPEQPQEFDVKEQINNTEQTLLESPSEESETPESRQSWVRSVQGEALQINMQRQASAQSTQAQLKVREQYKIQAYEFIKQLYVALCLLQQEQNQTSQLDLIEKIISQTLFKDKQRKISISFVAATSHRFTSELNQVRVNSTEIFKNIQADIERIAAESQLGQQKSGPKNAQQLDSSKAGYYNNPMMQSQHISRTGTQLTDTMPSLQFTPQKKGEEFGHIGVSQSISFANKGMSTVTGKQPHPFSASLSSALPGVQFDGYTDAPIDENNTLDYMHARYFFRKTIKRLQEDESSIWYDKVEEQVAEFKEIKEIYDQIQANLDPKQQTAESVWGKLDLVGRQPEVVKFIDQWVKNIETQSPQKNPTARNHFVSQRRNIDSWGRMMLLKPNRKALDYPSWLFYDFFVHDFLNKAFAVSLLSDEDFPDLVRPPQVQKVLPKKATPNGQGQKLTKKKVKSVQDITSPHAIQSPSNATENESDDSDYRGDDAAGENSSESDDQNQIETEDIQTLQQEIDSQAAVPYSIELQRVRNDIMQRMERNKLLQRVLTDKQPLKRNLTEDMVLVEKIEQKIRRIVKNEAENRIKQNIDYAFDAQNIKIKGTTWGKVIMTCDYFVYMSYCREIPVEKVEELKYVDREKNLIIRQELILKWENIEEIMRRKVLNSFQGIDVITQDKKCYTFNLTSLANCDSFMKNIKLLMKEREKEGEELSIRLIENPVTHFKDVEQYQNEWKNGQRTNMEFLLLINKYSGRSFNDLSQYPMFPWVLKDYDSNVYDFDALMKTDRCYRDFSMHTGMMGEEKRIEITKKYEGMKNNTGPDDKPLPGPEEYERQLYGDECFQMRYGFSTAMNTTMYLTRIEPFTTAAYFFQDQKRDKRVPISFEISFNVNTINEIQSNNELVPEHFYFPEALMNINNAHLGWQDDKKTGIDYQIDQMFIPQWAANHYDFVRIMREALEQKYVTDNLGHWIDLVFGIHQKSDQRYNKFFCIAYEEWHQEARNRKQVTSSHIRTLADLYIAPSRLFDQSLVSQTENYTAAAQSMQIDTTEAKTNFNPNFKLIKAFLEYKSSSQQKQQQSQKGSQQKQKLRLGQISVHNVLDQSTNIVHMLFNNEKKCLVFVRQDDSFEKRQEVGNLVVYVCAETLTKDGFKEKYFDLQMRYEWVAEELHNVFQVYFSQDSKNGSQSMKLFACGYMDNSLRIFDLDKQPGQQPPKIIHDHNARISCLKFSSDFKFLYTCDEDGVILHYGRKKLTSKDSKDSFPYSPLYKIQDQMDEILAIDTNQTLDMYVTLSRDGTIAVRCQRTSKLWVHFKMFCKRQNAKKEEVIITGFQKAFRRIDAIRLSLHGYIVLVGSSVAAKNNQSKYLVYNLNGDTLLAQMEEKCTIKNVFLNSTEDLMVLAQNCNLSQELSQQGNIRVLKLYGLEKIANLTKLCYEESLKEIKQQKTMNKNDQNNENPTNSTKQQIKTPIIGAIALKKGEVSLNIFYIEPSKQTKEIICFESSKSTVWSQLEDMALAPRQRQDF